MQGKKSWAHPGKSEFTRHGYIGNSDKLSVEDKKMFQNLFMGVEDEEFLYKEKFEFEVGRYATALKSLTTSLKIEKSIGIFDSDEAFCHGFFLSLRYGVLNYILCSNREERDGRPDIVLYLNRPKVPAIILEIKVRKKFNEMEDGLREAYDRINDKKYEEGVLVDGYAGVKSYGICFCKKSCIVGASK